MSVKLLNHFSLPDVASASIPLVHIVLVVVSVSVTVAEHDETNKADFVFISIQGEFTQILHWYSITNYILLSFSYHIYLSYVLIYINICFTYLSIFFICQDGYFDINAFYIKFFNKFYLPDVISAVIVLFNTMSLVVSVCVMVAGDDKPNKVEFVLIDICGKLTETLHWYDITQDTLHCLWYHMYLWHVFISMHIC